MMAVAKHAGVSHQTVSRVLNTPDSVRPQTRERVLASMAELGFRRNLAARALVTQLSGLVGIVWTGSGYFGPGSTVAAIEVAARAAGYSALVTAVSDRDEEELAAVFSAFRDRGVEGIAVVAPHQHMAERIRAVAAGVPTVVVADMGPDPDFHVVSVNQGRGAEIATNHLLQHGAQSVTHVSGPLGWFDALARIRGHRDALTAAGIEMPRSWVGDWTARRGHEIGHEMVANHAVPPAIFCGNDMTALGMLAAFREAGINAPRDVSIIGFDDVDGAGYFAPPLTTLRQPFDQLGALCLEVLLKAIAGEEPAVHAIEPELVARGSVL
ncbi:LacI family transcriptional regulator [Tessaracoccus antarcticus]|uniref:LacI family transcriptional regulator n=2 Tax=Tessaracoccus antarcticus TaxID=2479848 RepID=A0A3M0GL50_9ACTN|nr:LacI family transcriptional regulator [Tessaracoccus antarcticus]